jgi:endonuclease/exonuclease/phosphatase family metal-dependent hydrolase
MTATATLNRPRPASTAMRVMTFNIQSGSHGLPAVADAINSAEPDLVAMQEVDCITSRSNQLDQAAELSKLTGLAHHQHFRATDYHGGAYGLALVSRYPIAAVEQQMLPVDKGLEPRTLARAVVSVGGREVSIYLTHLTHLPTRSTLRLKQTRFILAEMAKDRRPKILLGDMNDSADSEAVAHLAAAMGDVFAQRGDGPGGTYPLPVFLPEIRIDYVFASREIRPLQSYVLRVLASDHFPLVADLEL